jgi:flagellar motor component MotA
LDTDEFIKAIEDAIKIAFNKQKNKGNIEDVKKEQKQAKEESIDKIVEENNKHKVNIKENEKLADFIKDHFTNASDETKVHIKQIMAEYEIKSLKDTEDTPTQAFREIAEVLK